MKNVNVRVPDDLHERVRATAEQERRSLNAQILRLIERGLKEPEIATGEDPKP